MLDSYNTNSYTGPLYKAIYFIDLNHIITNNDDYSKSYYMYCTFISEAGDNTTNLINSTNVYTLHIDMGKGINVFQYKNVKTPSFILPVLTILNEASANSPYTSFYLKDSDQCPVVVPNMLNINYIAINVNDASTNSTTTAAVTNYVCCLTFVEC